MADKPIFSSVDDYITSFSKEVQDRMQLLRQTIRESAPDAEEAIRWSMPTYLLNGNLVHFAAHQHHIGFYPSPSAILHFSGQLSGYKTSKGTVQFPLEKPLPLDLVRDMVRFRVEEQLST